MSRTPKKVQSKSEDTAAVNIPASNVKCPPGYVLPIMCGLDGCTGLNKGEQKKCYGKFHCPKCPKLPKEKLNPVELGKYWDKIIAAHLEHAQPCDFVPKSTMAKIEKKPQVPVEIAKLMNQELVSMLNEALSFGLVEEKDLKEYVEPAEPIEPSGPEYESLTKGRQGLAMANFKVEAEEYSPKHAAWEELVSGLDRELAERKKDPAQRALEATIGPIEDKVAVLIEQLDGMQEENAKLQEKVVDAHSKIDVLTNSVKLLGHLLLSVCDHLDPNTSAAKLVLDEVRRELEGVRGSDAATVPE